MEFSKHIYGVEFSLYDRSSTTFMKLVRKKNCYKDKRFIIFSKTLFLLKIHVHPTSNINTIRPKIKIKTINNQHKLDI